MIKIGTPVINSKVFWCSGYIIKKDDVTKWQYVHDKSDRDKIKKSLGYEDCHSRHREEGISGVIVDVNEEFEIYLIRWDIDGTFCGKPSDAFVIDYQKVREEKLSNLGL